MRTLGIALTSVFLLQVIPGQSISGSISGVVKDLSGVVVNGAMIQAHSAQLPGTYRAVSGKDGKYRLTDMPAGAFDLQVAAAAMKTFERKGVAVAAGHNVTLDVTLEYNTQLGTLGEDRETATADAKRHHPPPGPAPRTAEGKPDLTGVWWSPRTVDPGKVELQPWAEAVTKERLENNRKDTPQAQCLPNAVLRLGPLFEFVQTKNFLVIIADDDYPGFHQVYLDGRPIRQTLMNGTVTTPGIGRATRWWWIE